jgi:DNA-binding FadR family transcriptional regulator
MNNERRDPYGAALAKLKQMARDGRFAWGESMVIKALSAELRLSSTPVREALACMAGEGLIERRRGHGYFFPALTAADIIDLCDLQWTYIHAALTLHGRGVASLQKALAAVRKPYGFAALFEAVVEHTGNEPLIAVYAITLDRLTAVCRILGQLQVAFDPAPDELADLITQGSERPLIEGFERHHRQRSAHAGEIARRLRKEAASRI